MGKANTERILSFDIIKLLCYVGLVFIHATVFFTFMVDPHSKSFLMLNTINSAIRFAVPCFIMITGALHLNEDKVIQTKQYLIKYVVRMLIVLVFWVAVYTIVYFVFFNQEPITPELVINSVISFKVIDLDFTWYLFFLIGFYLVVPILRLFVKRENRKLILYLIVLTFLFQFVPATIDIYFQNEVTTYIKFFEKFYITLASKFIFYALVGWYLVNFPPKTKTRITFYIVGILAIVIQLTTLTLKGSLELQVYGALYGDNVVFIPLYGIAFFMFMQKVLGSRKSPKWFSENIKAGFGVYLTHMLFMEFIFRAIVPNINGGTGILIGVLIMAIGSFVGSFAISFILSRIPGIKYLFSA